MAGWIKACDTLPDCPAMFIMKRHLGGSLGDVFLLAVRWLFFLDKNTQDGKTHLLPDEVDSHFHTPNFTAALVAATWAKIEKDGTVSAQDYEIHNGDTTKKRLMQSIYDSRRGQTKSRKQSGKSQKEIWNIPENNLEISRKKSGQEKEKKKQKEKEYIYIYNNKGGEYKEGSFNSAPAPQTLAAPAAPPPFEKKSIFRSPDERAAYKAWLAQVKAAHPAGREMQEMGAKLHGTALAAFRAVPQAGEHGELLAAFYASAIDTSTNGKPFKRPNEFIWYLTDLADVLVAAKRWQKETRWKPKSATPAQLPPPPAPPAEEMTEEEKQSFFSAMRPNRHHQQNASECA